MIIDLGLGLTGPSPEAILKQVCALAVAGSGFPTELMIDNEACAVTNDWLDMCLPKAEIDITAKWKDYHNFVSYNIPEGKISLLKERFQLEWSDFIMLLSHIPFTLCSTRTIHDNWGTELTGEQYTSIGFGGLHYGFGWGCAFKAEGHQYLLSRRVLDYGPWRIIRGEQDVTLVQFHDMEVPALDALQQVKPGHRFMSDHFIQPFYTYVQKHEIGGLYAPDNRKLKIIVHGRRVPISEMKDVCAIRLYQMLGPEKPIDDVAYTFAVENEARSHLHDLWLCGLECWTFEGGRERRLDLDYSPSVPEKPDWVKRLEDKTGQ